VRSLLLSCACAFLFFALTGCILSDLDLSGKTCPCSGGYVCDTAKNICVRTIAANDAEVTDTNTNPTGDAQTNSDASEEPLDAGPQADADAGGIPSSCTLDSDCNDAAYICEAMTCIRGCGVVGGITCPQGQVCNPNNRRCITGELPLGSDCTINGQCADGYCLNVTTSSAAGNQKFCSVPCSATTDCPLNLSCLNLGGIAFCMRESAYAPPGNFDSPPGAACEGSTNTCQGRTCNLDTLECVQRCTRESDCAGFGDNCWTWAEGSYSGICFLPNGATAAVGAACGSDTQCFSGVCNRYQSVCAGHCCTEADCAVSETCAIYDITPAVPVKICRPRAVTGMSPLGASCTTDLDCESEVCAPANSDGSGAKKCSLLCCEPSDCTVLPNGGLCWPVAGALAGTVTGKCLPQ
jgi:hypothetical protein